MSQAMFEHYQRGMRSLLALIGPDHPRIEAVRALLKRLIENLTTADQEGDSPAHVADRAEILYGLNRLALELTHRSFEALCDQESEPTPLVIGTQEQLNTLQEYVEWMNGLLLAEKLRVPVVRRFVQARTMTLLPKLNATDKGKLVQFLYDAVLITMPKPLLSLSGMDLQKAHLVQADLAKGNLTGADLTGANMAGANLEHLVCRRANLALANLSWTILRGGDLRDVEMGGATLTGAELRGANIQNAHLVKANLRRADLTQAQMQGANLLGANLEEAVFTAVNLSGANLLWANFERARLDGTVLEGANYNQHTHWPDGFDPETKGAKKIG